MKTKILAFLCGIGLFMQPLHSQVQNGALPKKVAILEVANMDGDLKNGDLIMILGTLTTAVTNMHGYQGYERTDIGQILGEQNFQRTGMVSDAQIKRIGEMDGAQYVLASKAAQMSNGKLAITAKMMNVETSEISQNAVVQTTMTDLEKGCLELVGKLFGYTQGSAAQGNVSSFNYKMTGVLMVGNDKYEGEYINGKPHGKGIMTFAANDEFNRRYYEGDWVNGVRQGLGTMVWNDGAKYIGNWKDGGREGRGVAYYTNGERYEGDWVDDKRHGNGRYYWPDGDYENANYQNDEEEGGYTCYFANGNKRVGTYKNGKKEGFATFYFEDGDYCTEYWLNDKEHGTHEYYDQYGRRYKTEIYENGVLQKTKKH